MYRMKIVILQNTNSDSSQRLLNMFYYARIQK